MKKIIKKVDQSLDLKEYVNFLEQIKLDIAQTQIKAASAITKELMKNW